MWNDTAYCDVAFKKSGKCSSSPSKNHYIGDKRSCFSDEKCTSFSFLNPYENEQESLKWLYAGIGCLVFIVASCVGVGLYMNRVKASYDYTLQ